MNKVFIAVLAFSVVGCSSMIQKGSISKANESFQERHYDDTLKYIAQAEATGQNTPEQKAELTYLKAETYEMMGQNDKAKALYQYLKDQCKNTQYGYLAEKKLTAQ
jgi:hypothetical protein